MYPTKEEILAKPISIDDGTIAVLRSWKTTTWRKARKQGVQERNEALRDLIEQLGDLHEISVKVEFDENLESCKTYIKEGLILLDGRTSIISALHEFAHLLYGNDELIPCRWSISAFSIVFPKAMETLQWDGHMLVRNEPHSNADPCTTKA